MAFPGNQLGWSVAISGDTVAAGADINTPPGAVYVFVKPAGGWTNMSQNAKLTTAERDTGDGFGLNCAVSGRTVVVGTPYYKSEHGLKNHGAVYVFVEPQTGWTNMTQTARLTTSSGQGRTGFSVSISGNTIAAGAPEAVGRNGLRTGASYVFVKPTGHWQNTSAPDAVLTASDGNGGDQLGYSTSISGNTVVAGAPCAPCFACGCGSGIGPGAAYGFIRPLTGWASETESGKLLASDGKSGDYFGSSVSVNGSVVLVLAQGRSLIYAFRYIGNAGFTSSTAP